MLCACICWGIENNCTRSISEKSSEQIVLIKGIFYGVGSVVIGLVTGESFPKMPAIFMAMLLGFVAYGLSINFYISAQKTLGAAKTSAFYSIAPFLGVGFSFLILGERPKVQFYFALLIMAISTLVMIRDTLGAKAMLLGYSHTHEHRHGNVIHTHEHRHLTLNPVHMHMHGH